jgi:hypothetical protein
MDDYVHPGVLFYPVGDVGNVGGLQMQQLTIGAWLEADTPSHRHDA